LASGFVIDVRRTRAHVGSWFCLMGLLMQRRGLLEQRSADIYVADLFREPEKAGRLVNEVAPTQHDWYPASTDHAVITRERRIPFRSESTK
jgi:hypothetical protein